MALLKTDTANFVLFIYLHRNIYFNSFRQIISGNWCANVSSTSETHHEMIWCQFIVKITFVFDIKIFLQDAYICGGITNRKSFINDLNLSLNSIAFVILLFLRIGRANQITMLRVRVKLLKLKHMAPVMISLKS